MVKDNERAFSRVCVITFAIDTNSGKVRVYIQGPMDQVLPKLLEYMIQWFSLKRKQIFTMELQVRRSDQHCHFGWEDSQDPDFHTRKIFIYS